MGLVVHTIQGGGLVRELQSVAGDSPEGAIERLKRTQNKWQGQDGARPLFPLTV